MNEEPTIDELIRAVAEAKRGLIPVLQEIQNREGWISEALIERIAGALNRKPREIVEIVDFDPTLRRAPRGRRHVEVCMAVSCEARGSQAVLERVREELGLAMDGVTSDGAYSLAVRFCLGACGQGPNLRVNDRLHHHVEPEDVPRLLSETD